MHTDRNQNNQPTIAGLLRDSASALRTTSDSARLDAEVLLAHVLGRSRVQLYGAGEDRVRPEIAARFITLIRARREGRPVAQLVGSREFWSMKLSVTPDTLIPRPETELLVECALNRIARRSRADVLDLGTGTGAVALAIARERPNSSVTATDISEPALAVARYNAATYGLGNVTVNFGDWFGAVPDRRFDTIVANPPYVTDKEWLLHIADLAYEPALALRGGRDGLMAIRKIIARAGDHLAPGGWLLIEHGFRQGPDVADLFLAHGFRRISTYRDLPGHPRVTEGKIGQPDAN